MRQPLSIGLLLITVSGAFTQSYYSPDYQRAVDRQAEQNIRNLESYNRRLAYEQEQIREKLEDQQEELERRLQEIEELLEK